MNLRRIACLLALALLPAPHAWALHEDEELYHAEVCNAGQRTVDVAVAYHEWGLSSDPYWMIEYWSSVKPGACTEVFNHYYVSNNLLRQQTFPLHLAFAFTELDGRVGRREGSSAQRRCRVARAPVCDPEQLPVQG